MQAGRFLIALILGVFAGGVGALRAQTAPAKHDFLPTGELRVGIDPEQPPLIFIQNDRVSGVEADLARAFATDLGVPLNFVVMDWDELIPALNEGKIDIIMSGMTATEIRSVRVNFTAPYLYTGQMPMVRAGDSGRYPTTLALTNCHAKVGVEKGTTGDFFVRENFPFAECVPYADSQMAAAALAAGEVDMVVADAPTIWWLAAEHENQGLTPLSTLLSREGIAWAVDKSNPGLLIAAETFLRNYRMAGRLGPVILRWLPVSAIHH